jgi:hypothetical protein
LQSGSSPPQSHRRIKIYRRIPRNIRVCRLNFCRFKIILQDLGTAKLYEHERCLPRRSLDLEPLRRGIRDGLEDGR